MGGVLGVFVAAGGRLEPDVVAAMALGFGGLGLATAAGTVRLAQRDVKEIGARGLRDREGPR